MQVSAIQSQSATAANQSSESSAAAAPDYNAFLKLLVTEMKNQDPTKPMDPTQTVSQLATFSGVEQAVKTNSLLNAIVVNSGLSQGAALVGKTLTSADGAITGVVQSVLLQSNGLLATLSDGRTVHVGAGVTVS